MRQSTDEPELHFFKRLAPELSNLMWLDIGGGEPFLRDDLPEICALFKTQILSIPTNGWDSDRIMLLLREVLAQRSDQILLSLSLDGPQEIHDTIRGKGSYDRALNTFERLRSLDRLLIKINTVVSQENLAALPEFLVQVRRVGPDAHSLVLLRGDPRDPEMQVPTAEELHKLLPSVLSELQHYSYGNSSLGRRILQSYHRFLWDVSIATLEQRTQVVPCLGGSNHIVIWPDKTVGSCEMLSPIASLENSSLSDVVSSSAWKKQRRFIAAKGCWCTHNCALLASIPFHVPSQARLLFRTLTSQSHG